jgi:hypothetical protein
MPVAAAAPAPTFKPEPIGMKRTLPLQNRKQAGSVFLNFYVKVPLGHTLADLLEPYYWGNHAKNLRLYGVLTCIAEDGSFDVDLRVIALSDTWAKMRIIREWVLPEGETVADPSPARDRFEVNFTSEGKWRVLSKDNGKVLIKDLPNKSEAERWLDQHLKTVFKG